MAEEFAPLDRIDREILDVLRSDGRIPWQTLGARVHLSANAAADRARRLLRRGVIRRYTADINQAALGRDLEAVVDVIVVGDHVAFVDAVRGRDEVSWMAYVTGRFEYRMHVACAGTRGLDELLAWMRAQGAGETYTTVVLRRLI